MIEIWATQALGEFAFFQALDGQAPRVYGMHIHFAEKALRGWMDGDLEDDFMIGYMAVGWLVSWFGGSDWGQVLPRKFALRVGDEKSSSFC